MEQDEDCLATLQKNRPQWEIAKTTDVNQAASVLRPSQFDIEAGDLDLIAGGPPCQPFSNAAQWTPTGKRGLQDARAATIDSTLDIIEAFLPRAIFIENVSGFARGKHSASAAINFRLDQINRGHGTCYNMLWAVVNAAEYGVPQDRRRAIGIAIRDAGKCFTFPEPIQPSRRTRAWDAIGDLPMPSPEEYPPAGRWRDLLAAIPEGHNYQWLTAKGGGPEVFGYRTKYWSFLLKLAKNRPAWTIPASPGPSTGPFHWEGRHLSVRERMRLQTFPDDWEYCGDLRARIRMAGNATPPLLAEVIGRAIRSCLTGQNQVLGQPILAIRMANAIPQPEPLGEFPKSFGHLVGARSPHPGTGLGPAPRAPAAGPLIVKGSLRSTAPSDTQRGEV